MGVAFLDAAARKAGACEFADDEHFCSLEAVLLQLGAKEVVLPKARPRAACGVRVTCMCPGAGGAEGQCMAEHASVQSRGMCLQRPCTMWGPGCSAAVALWVCARCAFAARKRSRVKVAPVRTLEACWRGCHLATA